MLLRVTEGREAFGPLAIRINTELVEDNPHDFDCLSVAAKPGVVVSVEWGDGSDLDSYVFTSDAPVLLTHYYETPGVYLVRVIGDLLSIDTLTPTDSRAAVTDILSFGESLASARFEDCVNLTTVSATILPTNITRLCFTGCQSLAEVDCARWDTSGITDMSYMFAIPLLWGNKLTLPAGSWNTSNVTDMRCMFRNVYVELLPGGVRGVSGWDTSKVTNMEGMFQSAILGPDGIATLGPERWDTSRVTDMSSMFDTTQVIDVPDFTGWDTRSVTDMSFMFRRAIWLNDPDLTSWDTSQVTTMQSMFDFAQFNGNVSSWQVGNVQNMSRMFIGTRSPFNCPVGDWDTKSVTDMSFMFAGCNDFNQPIGGWNVSNVTSIASMLSVTTGGSSFNQPLNDWDVRRVVNFSNFLNAPSTPGGSFNQPLDKWDIDSATNGLNFLNQQAPSPYSTKNWDDLLVAWNSRKANYVTNLNIRCNTRTSTAGGGAAAKAALRTYGWTITDSGNI
jgi:surface protein